MERVNDDGRAGREAALLKLREWLQEQVPVEGRPAIRLPFVAVQERMPGERRLTIHPFVGEMIRRLWDQVAEDLNRGRYGDVLHLRRRLDEQVTQTRENYYAWRRTQSTLHYTLRLLKDHMSRYGDEATLAGSLGRRPPYTPEQGFYWAVAGPVADREGPEYTLTIPPAVVRSERLGPTFPVLPLGECLAYGPLPGRLTWREALALPEAALKDNPAEEAASRLHLLQFRLSVLDAAIWEYETYGVVPPLTEQEVADLFEAEMRRRERLKDLRKDRDVFFSELERLHLHEKLSQRAALDRLLDEIGGPPEFYAPRKEETDEEDAKDSLVRSFHNWRKKRPG
ncbi:hypothetical protein GQ464_008865 [Rhodocaloribacter litoris]|uniref:hypothetical protein n=1 Tax=Rhodocaloribacter litoris TaxID=2558931 RepID=UPI00141EA4E2|nr:hypothetical protein [Rhodocaloribacter litoris]QXD17026.1 hypothetical protein GQ464_008865 [Rhodocaloribacter litoris]